MSVASQLPMQGVDLLLGNDLASDEVVAMPIMNSIPCDNNQTKQMEKEYPSIFPACAVSTRSQAKANDKIPQVDNVDLTDTFMTNLDTESNISVKNVSNDLFDSKRKKGDECSIN